MYIIIFIYDINRVQRHNINTNTTNNNAIQQLAILSFSIALLRLLFNKWHFLFFQL